MLPYQAEAYSEETFQCEYCKHGFQTSVVTWVDVSRTPRARMELLRWEFNIIQCPRCGFRHFAGSPFFYEDFEEGLLIAVFPAIPDQREEIEKKIKSTYSYYPHIEFFYDMTQIWLLVYLQYHRAQNATLYDLEKIGEKEERTCKFLRFIKEDPLMLRIREKMVESFRESAAYDELITIVERAMFSLEDARVDLRDKGPALRP